MSENLSEKYPHLQFRKHWELTENSAYLLGECASFIEAICNTPILPEYKQALLTISLIKGAQATTAIEGNTLTDNEVILVNNGEKLPPSKEYQAIEVANVLSSYNDLLNEVVYDDVSKVITPELILRFHRMVGKDLGEHLGAIPGRFRDSFVTVGNYRAPDYKDVPDLVDEMCNWLLIEFGFEKGPQRFKDFIIQALVSHVYLEWIHPFSDGNGRTGRLLEFYILLRGGLPNIASHILSNHYNETRPEYYRQLQLATRNRNLTSFIEYALQGFRDGLHQTLRTIQQNQFKITWDRFVYDKFKESKMVNKAVFKRRRELALQMPYNVGFTLDELVLINPIIARDFANLSSRSVVRDLHDLQSMGLIRKEGKLYFSNANILGDLMAPRKGKQHIF